MVLIAESSLILVFTLTLGLATAQEPVSPPVCPQPAPICRSYEVHSCEWALNMVPVYVCRTDIGALLVGLGGGLGYQPRPQTVIYQPYNQPPVYPPFARPQPIYATFTTRQPAQYRQFTVSREADVQPLSPNGQSGGGSQQGFASRAAPQSGYQGGTRDPPPNGQSPSHTSQPIGTHIQRQPAPQVYQRPSQSASSAALPQSAQPSYPESPVEEGTDLID